jgi:hypothetical protein
MVEMVRSFLGHQDSLMDFLPLFHNLKGRMVLVVGGGEIALRKARLLSEAGAVKGSQGCAAMAVTTWLAACWRSRPPMTSR